MRKLALAALAASTLIATPAFAQEADTSNFTGVRVGITGGAFGNDIADFDNATVGLEVGYDVDLGGAVVGIGAEYQNATDDLFGAREIGAIARVGAKIGDRALLYVNGGYSNVSATYLGTGGGTLDGLRAGVGAEFSVGGPLSLKVEQRYYNYEGVNGFQTVAGLGFRF